MPDRLAKTKPAPLPASKLLEWLADGEKIVGAETMKDVRRAIAEQLYENLVFSEYRLSRLLSKFDPPADPEDIP